MPLGEGRARCRTALGARDGIAAKNLLGAILNEGGLAREAIGRIQVRDSFSLVELPEDGLDRWFLLLPCSVEAVDVHAQRAQGETLVDDPHPLAGTPGEVQWQQVFVAGMVAHGVWRLATIVIEGHVVIGGELVHHPVTTGRRASSVRRGYG